MGIEAAADAGVSAREAEVLAAVGEHRTNAEIAARLFISIRTVESHVSSLLRKLGVNDRRALAELAAAADPGVPRVASALPSALTPFVGRTAERAALAELIGSALIGSARLITAMGPGGVGKTRLALAVAADVSDRFEDGVWYVDLVPVTDPAMLAPTVAGALGLGEQPGRSTEDTLLGWAGDRRAVLVLDNCEHLLDAVAELAERLLARGSELVVLATSRARLMLPFERVFPVSGLSVADGDAVALFVERASAAGFAPSGDDRVNRICRSLDGVPLAIELAAARLPALGLDGLEAGLADRLQLLAGSRRVDGRHRSLRSTLDWSYALLEEPAQALLRRVSAFAGPFTAADAAVVASGPPVGRRVVGEHLAALADHSLLMPVPAADGTRYRVLETVRQYGAELLDDAAETDGCHLRHLWWAHAAGTDLLGDPARETAGWRTGFDRVADELRAALKWAATRPDQHRAGHEGATVLAALCLVRGMPGEAVRRYEQAAELAPDAAAAAVALRRAAGAASAGLAGNDALRLHRAAADAALRAGDPADAAHSLAQVAELIHRGPGIIASPPDPAAAAAALDEARKHAGDDPRALARIACAEAFAVAESDPAAAEATERALRLARAAGDPLAESAALDRLTTVQLSAGAVRDALGSAARRIELIAPLPVDAELGFEMSDSHVMATETSIGAGELVAARRYAEAIRDLPQHREIGHVGVARLVTVSFLAGDWATTLSAADRFRDSWERAGRPQVPTLRRTAHTVATLHALRGDETTRAEWLEIVAALVLPGRPGHDRYPRNFFDSLVELHHDRPDRALALLADPPAALTLWYDGIWRPWYAAARAEAAVLAGVPDAAEQVAAARPATAHNPVAVALVDRAAALAAGDTAAVLAAAAALDAAGSRYQWARSLLLAGGSSATAGLEAMAELVG